jgi:hypothetical protein
MNLVFDPVHEVNFLSMSHGETLKVHDFLQTHNRIRNRVISSLLQEDLIEHLWKQHGDE